MRVIKRPAVSFGLAAAHITVSAVWDGSSNSSGSSALATTAVHDATFQVQLPSLQWAPVCSESVPCDTDANCTGTECSFSYSYSSTRSSQYLLQVKAVLTGAEGDATAVSWSFVKCSSTQYAVINNTDGAVVCVACTLRPTSSLLTKEFGTCHGCQTPIRLLTCTLRRDWNRSRGRRLRCH